MVDVTIKNPTKHYFDSTYEDTVELTNEISIQSYNLENENSMPQLRTTKEKNVNIRTTPSPPNSRNSARRDAVIAFDSMESVSTKKKKKMPAGILLQKPPRIDYSNNKQEHIHAHGVTCVTVNPTLFLDNTDVNYVRNCREHIRRQKSMMRKKAEAPFQT